MNNSRFIHLNFLFRELYKAVRFGNLKGHLKSSFIDFKWYWKCLSAEIIQQNHIDKAFLMIYSGIFSKVNNLTIKATYLQNWEIFFQGIHCDSRCYMKNSPILLKSDCSHYSSNLGKKIFGNHFPIRLNNFVGWNRTLHSNEWINIKIYFFIYAFEQKQSNIMKKLMSTSVSSSKEFIYFFTN